MTKVKDIIVKPLDLFFFKSVTLFQSKFKTPIKKHNKYLHQQSLSINDTDIIKDDEDHIYTRIPKDSTPFTPDTTIATEHFSTITISKTDTPSKMKLNLQSIVHKSFPFMIHLSLTIKIISKDFFTRRLLFRYNYS